MRLAKLCSILPSAQRKYAAAKVQSALKFGWVSTSISIWCEAPFEPHERDLVGVHPKHGFDFLPDVDSEG
jgi:hypothetical protein